MTDIIKEKLARSTTKPGVYLMKGEGNEIIYVGKAKNLKKRLSSYFNRPAQPDMKTGVLVSRIIDFETIVTATEQEALILESNLIKRHRPRYNVILKDGKRYPSIRINLGETYPYLSIVRKVEKDGSLYFGPFASSSSVHATVKMINKTFKLRKCKNAQFAARTRPCLNYQMNACLGLCCLDVDRKEYDEIVKEVILFLKGRTPDLINKIKSEMTAAAEQEKFELAAQLRDKLFAVEKTLEKQMAVTSDLIDRDIVALERKSGYALFTILFVRGGSLLGSRHFEFSETMGTDSELIASFIGQYYEKTPFIPKEILVSVPMEDSDTLCTRLGEIKGRKVSIHHPVRGEKTLLVKMALANAAKEMEERIASKASGKDMLVRLKKRLGMESLPARIECFDNSNISGTNPVSAMVVFEDGKPAKSAYRKYKIRSVTEHDDYAYMAEVLTRRYSRDESEMPLPDILMVDGGKGQMNIAVSVIRDLGLTGAFEIIGIAKKDEMKGETSDKIFKPGRANPVNLGRDGDILLFLGRIRDEAHRFAITFHRKTRGKSAVVSVFDTIPGIGKARKKSLLKHFKSIKKIREASPEELADVPGMNMKAALSVHEALNQ